MIRAVILSALVVMAFSADCPTDGSKALQPCDCKIDSEDAIPVQCSIGEYCMVSGDKKRCVDSPLCPFPGSGTSALTEECYCKTIESVVNNEDVTTCPKYWYCKENECHEYRDCSDGDILTESCVYGTKPKSICRAGQQFSNNKCVNLPETCTTESGAGENCRIQSTCYNTTICDDEFGVPNGCGEMPLDFEGDNACKSGFECIKAGEKAGECSCSDAVNAFDPNKKCLCDCALYRQEWQQGACSSGEMQQKYKEAYNECNCNNNCN